MTNEITAGLLALQDTGYKAFHAKLIPTVPPEKIIGVRNPVLRSYAKEVAKRPDAADFLRQLPHEYYEENNLHGVLLTLLYKKPEPFLEELEKFLPYIDNWATCDMLSPKVFRKNLPLVLRHVDGWLASDQPYIQRFAVVTLLQFFLDDAFTPEILARAAAVQSEEYYVRMAVAWFFSFALIKQYEAAIGYFTAPVLDVWTHNKAIQKAIESYRLTDETKNYLRSLKRRK